VVVCSNAAARLKDFLAESRWSLRVLASALSNSSMAQRNRRIVDRESL
jgi:hypothetical protein